MKAIVLTRGRIATVDDEDFESLNQFKWFAVKEKDGLIYYAARNKTSPDGKRHMVQMHREILGITDPKIPVDHKSGEGTDNRRENLRTATGSNNCANARKKRGNFTSEFKGVYKTSGPYGLPWSAAVGGRNREWLGTFKTEEEAARAYDAGASRLFGTFAKLNFPI